MIISINIEKACDHPKYPPNSKNAKIVIQRDILTPMFIATLFITAK